MKKKTITLEALAVSSFITEATNLDKIGGGNDVKTTSQWRDCTYINCTEPTLA